MKQQFLELIDRYISQGNWDEKQLCRQIRSEVEKMEEWIPVTERLPEDNRNVIWIDSSGNTYFDSKKKYSLYGGMTHWMPLPNPPTI